MTKCLVSLFWEHWKRIAFRHACFRLYCYLHLYTKQQRQLQESLKILSRLGTGGWHRSMLGTFQLRFYNLILVWANSRSVLSVFWSKCKHVKRLTMQTILHCMWIFPITTDCYFYFIFFSNSCFSFSKIILFICFYEQF